MPVERASFLALTYALFGCNGPGPVVAGSMVDIPMQPAARPAVVDAAPEAAAKPYASTPIVAAAEPEEEEEDDAGASATCGWVDPAAVTRPAAACADDKGAAPACPPMKACSGVTFPKM